MKNVLRSTFGTFVVAAFLAIAPPMYAGRGHGGGHGGNRSGHAMHAGGHAAVAHVRGGHAGHFREGSHGFAMRAGRGNSRAVFARGNARYAGGARITRLVAEAGLEAEAGEAVTGIRTMDTPGSAITAWATATRMADITVTDPVGATIRITDIVRADLILTDTGTGLIWASASVATKLNHQQRESGRSKMPPAG
jgi:hypothetical protein